MGRVCILGAGSWGTALAVLLSGNIECINIWGRPQDDVDIMQASRENKRFLPGVQINERIFPTTNLATALEGCSLVVMAVPSQALRSVLETVKPYLPRKVNLINTAKGLEIATGMRLSQVVKDVLGAEVLNRFAVLSGPSHAEEVARKVPTAVTVAAYKRDTAYHMQEIFMSPAFRVYTNPDVAGVELGGALKNIVALATGIIDGLGYGDNTKAALMTRGLTEITRMGEALGGDPRTFMGLSGMGDLVVTCSSRHSRNRRAGELIGRGYSLEAAIQEVGMVVEGVHTTRVAYHLAQKLNVEMPICTACYHTLFENKPVREGVEWLMTRRKKNEIEEIAEDISGWQ